MINIMFKQGDNQKLLKSFVVFLTFRKQNNKYDVI